MHARAKSVFIRFISLQMYHHFKLYLFRFIFFITLPFSLSLFLIFLVPLHFFIKVHEKSRYNCYCKIVQFEKILSFNIKYISRIHVSAYICSFYFSFVFFFPTDFVCFFVHLNFLWVFNFQICCLILFVCLFSFRLYVNAIVIHEAIHVS